MSQQPELNLDDILEEFYREESQPPQSPEPKPARPRAAAAILSSGEKAGEGTILYENRPARHAAPAPEPAPTPQAEEKPSAPRQAEKPAPAQKSDKPAPKQPAPRQPAERPAPRRSPGKGFALMILVLLLLGAALFGLVKWTVRAERAAAPQEPEPLRLELGLSLEQSLDESAGTTR